MKIGHYFVSFLPSIVVVHVVAYNAISFWPFSNVVPVFRVRFRGSHGVLFRMSIQRVLHVPRVVSV